MITDDELKQLLDYKPRAGTRVLTVYLNVNQGYAPNLNRGFEVTLRNSLREIEEGLSVEDRKGFARDAEKCREFVKGYNPTARTLLYLVNSADGFQWSGNLRLSLDNSAHWATRPYVRPLIEARDENERYGIILTDRAQARLFTVMYDEIEENEVTLAEADVKRFDAAGKDQMWSQMQLQHKADEHARWHLKRVAEVMDDLGRRQTFSRLILAGPAEATSELHRLLSDQMRNRVIGSAAIALISPEKDILKETRGIIQEYERNSERSLLERLLTSARKHQQAVVGLPGTVDAVSEGRVQSLVYAAGFEANGTECISCGKLSQDTPERCPHCDGEVLAVDDLLERLVEVVARSGGAVEQMREDAAEELQRNADGIGAVLRF
jgi:peptide subunit release factor 1 (eRF1)